MAEGSTAGSAEIFPPSKRTQSEVWTYFGFYKDTEGRLVEDSSPVCRKCHKKVSATGGNTSNMMAHLRDHHPQLCSDLKSSLQSVFLAFGPVYLLKVCPNAPLAPPGFYALVKFYSCLQALEAQRQTDGRTLFQNTPLKVRLSSKQTPHFLLNNSPPLSHARCLELANHCLGFNGWTSDIVRIKELTNEEEEEEGGVRRRRLRFGCLMELNFPHHGRTTRGAAVVEDSFTCTGPEVLFQKRCRLMKLVKDKALVQAFSTVLLILLGNSKVMVELKQASDQLEPEPNQQVLQVNEFSWAEFPRDDDDDEGWPLDLSVS